MVARYSLLSILLLVIFIVSMASASMASTNAINTQSWNLETNNSQCPVVPPPVNVSSFYVSGKVVLTDRYIQSLIHPSSALNMPANFSILYMDAQGKLKDYQKGFVVNVATNSRKNPSNKVWYEFKSSDIYKYLPCDPTQIKKIIINGMGGNYGAHFNNIRTQYNEVKPVPEPSPIISLSVLIMGLLSAYYLHKQPVRSSY